MKGSRLLIWGMALCVAVAFAGAIGVILTVFDHNEHMYLAAGVQVAQNKVIYRDFAYLQMPYLPLLYGKLLQWLPIQAYYLLAGKVVSCFFLGLSAATLFLIGRRVLGQLAPALGIVALFLLNMTIIGPAAEVSNYIAPLALSLLSFYAFLVSTDQARVKSLGLALSGFCLALAIGSKLTYAPTVVPFLIALGRLPAENGTPAAALRYRLTHGLAPFMGGLALGLLPLVGYLFDWDRFLFNNLGYHALNTQWRLLTGYAGAMSVAARLDFARQILTRTDNLILIAGVLLAIGLSLGRFAGQRPTGRRLPPGALLAMLLFLVAVPTALAPAPSFFQYFALPVSCLFLLLIYAWAPHAAADFRWRRVLLPMLVLVSVAFSGPGLQRSITRLLDPQTWSGVYVHQVAMSIRQALETAGVGPTGKIATLSPVYVIEANLPIYPQLATGPFLFRVGDLLTPAQRQRFVGASPQTVHELLDADPPVAILVGFEGDLDASLRDYAKQHNYAQQDTMAGGAELYIRPP